MLSSWVSRINWKNKTDFSCCDGDAEVNEYFVEYFANKSEKFRILVVNKVERKQKRFHCFVSSSPTTSSVCVSPISKEYFTFFSFVITSISFIYFSKCIITKNLINGNEVFFFVEINSTILIIIVHYYC